MYKDAELDVNLQNLLFSFYRSLQKSTDLFLPISYLFSFLIPATSDLHLVQYATYWTPNHRCTITAKDPMPPKGAKPKAPMASSSGAEDATL